MNQHGGQNASIPSRSDPLFSDGADRGRFSRLADVPWQQRLVPPAQVTLTLPVTFGRSAFLAGLGSATTGRLTGSYTAGFEVMRHYRKSCLSLRCETAPAFDSFVLTSRDE